MYKRQALVFCLLFGSSFGIEADSALVNLLKVLAGIFALLTMTYQGFAMSHSSAIAIWNSAILPLASFLYSLATGVSVLLVITTGGSNDLADALLLLLLALGVMHLMLLHAGWHGSPGARTSVELLLQTLYAKWFWGLTMAAGILLPGLLLWSAPDLLLAQLVACLGILAGFMAWRILIFKIGVYEPIMSMNPFNPLH